MPQNKEAHSVVHACSMFTVEYYSAPNEKEALSRVTHLSKMSRSRKDRHCVLPRTGEVQRGPLRRHRKQSWLRAAGKGSGELYPGVWTWLCRMERFRSVTRRYGHREHGAGCTLKNGKKGNFTGRVCFTAINTRKEAKRKSINTK